MTRRTRTMLLAVVGVLLAVVLVVVFVVLNRPPERQPRPPVTVDSATLREAITSANLTQHLAALQRIADSNGGNRQDGRPGHQASVDYVEEQLRAAGYEPQRQRVIYQRTEATLSRVGAGASGLMTGVDHQAIALSGNADVTAAVTAVDVNLDGDRETTSGCEASDFAGFPRGSVALLQRGTCRFDTKVDHAIEAGASAVVIFNQGDADDRLGLFSADLRGAPRPIPLVATTFDHGAAWASGDVQLRVAVDTSAEVVTENIIADTSGDPNGTVVVGAHLDGVASGPGINDNGSGVAAVLETAVQLAELDTAPTHRVRFAFWGGEEDGLHGSTQYVAGLDEAERDAHALYLNLDMVGSPNPSPAVYGDFDLEHPVEKVLRDFLVEQGVEPETATFEASDHVPFLAAGIPIGGLYTGADEGREGPADSCYHQACDRVDNIDPDMLGLMADALAHAILAVAG